MNFSDHIMKVDYVSDKKIDETSAFGLDQSEYFVVKCPTSIEKVICLMQVEIIQSCALLFEIHERI